MEQQRGKIKQFKKWLVLCYIANKSLYVFGPRQLILLFTLLIVSTLSQEQKPLHMRAGMVGSLMLSTSEHSAVNAISLGIVSIWENLTPEVMRGFYQAILLTVEHIVCTACKLLLLWNLSMWLWMTVKYLNPSLMRMKNLY